MNFKDVAEKSKRKPIIEYIVISLLIIVASIVFARQIGLLTCGYHFADDHEILRINDYISKNGLFSAISFFVIEDLEWRFRPFYFLLRVIRTFILGANFNSWHLLLAIETGVLMAISYVLARKMKVSIIPSIIFSFIFIIGSQDEVIWRLGPQENTGLLLLSLSFLLLFKYHETKNRTYCIFSTISLIMMMYCKESFLILAPSATLFLFFLEIKDEKDKESENIFKQLWLFIKRHKFFIAALLISIIISSIILFGYTGLFSSGYAGIDTKYDWKDYIRLIINVFVRDLVDYWIPMAGILALLIYAVLDKKIKKQLTKQYIRTIFVLLLFIGYSLVCEAFIYGSSAMFTRYYLPTVWIIFFTLIVLESNIMCKIPNTILAVLLLLLSLYSYESKERNVIVDAEYFADEGRNITKMLDYVGDLENSKDLIVLTKNYWYEVDYSISTYLQIKHGIKDVYYLDEEKEDGDYENIYSDSGKRIYIADADVIIIDDNMFEEFDNNKYDVNDFSVGYVLVKKQN